MRDPATESDDPTDPTVRARGRLYASLQEAGCTGLEALALRIGRKTFQCVRGVGPQRGTFIECLGPLPASYQRSRRTVYRLPYDQDEWYVAGWFPFDEPNVTHPWGRSFTLRPWRNRDGSLIDHWELPTAKYRRMGVTILFSSVSSPTP